jgi:preprotein translocase subunit YajC
MSGFLILILILGAAWLLFIVPARRRRQSHQSMQDSVDIGDEIITAGGLHGFVREMGDDTLRVEISPGVVATLDRRAVAAVAREVVEVEPEPGPEPAEDHHELPEEDPKDGADTSKRANESPAEPG